MAARHYKELITWQLAEAFSDEVHRLVRASPQATRDLRFHGQILNAAGGPSKHTMEGFLRYSPGDFARFLDYALGSLVETDGHLRDGVKRGYFRESDIIPAVRLSKRCFKATVRLKWAQLRYIARLKEERRSQRRRKGSGH